MLNHSEFAAAAKRLRWFVHEYFATHIDRMGLVRELRRLVDKMSEEVDTPHRQQRISACVDIRTRTRLYDAYTSTSIEAEIGSLLKNHYPITKMTDEELVGEFESALQSLGDREGDGETVNPAWYWVSVKSALPEHGTEQALVLKCTLADGSTIREIHEGYYAEDLKEWWKAEEKGGGRFEKPWEVTHWRNLPPTAEAFELPPEEVS